MDFLVFTTILEERRLRVASIRCSRGSFLNSLNSLNSSVCCPDERRDCFDREEDAIDWIK